METYDYLNQNQGKREKFHKTYSVMEYSIAKFILL